MQKRTGIAVIGNRIFLERSIEMEAADIVHEIKTYILNQYKKGMLHPEFYDSVLLFSAEILPYAEKPDIWLDLGYQLCREIKQRLESQGYRHQIAMVGGLGYRCFAVNAFCARANLLQGFSHSLNRLLFTALDHTLNELKNGPMFDRNYDAISGISGTLYYLLDYSESQEENRSLIRCAEYLLSLTQDREFCGKPVIGFHVPQENQIPDIDRESFQDGSINFGLAHGMLGPLIALAKAHAKGFAVDGLKEGIERLYHLYETYQSKKGIVPYWPGKITVEEYRAGTSSAEHLHQKCSWCYGNIGILRGLQKVAAYMNWPAREQRYIAAMQSFFAQDIKDYNLISPSLCHGFSSLAAVQTCAYAGYRDPKLLWNLERNVREIIKGYRKSNAREVNLTDIQNKLVWVEGYLKDLSLLTGSVGIAITLLSLKGTIQAAKLLMID